MARVDKQKYLSDFYNKYENSLNGKTIHELIDYFNSEQGVQVASHARFQFLSELDRAFRASGFDCSSIENKKGLKYKYPIKLEGECIVQIIED
tara:strand:+ start:696 stop:974 length:279 start_codon:yes stop_codon:yes gene_type:complete